MTMKGGAIFEEKLTCDLENDRRNLVNFHQSTQKSQNWNVDEIPSSKKRMYELKMYTVVICHDNEEGCKI